MDREEFLDRLYEVKFTAGMNQRYHQILAQKWYRLDCGFKIATGLVATLACISAFASGWTIFSQVTAIVAAILAVSLNVLPFGEWRQIHLDIFRRWSDLLEDAEVFDISIPDKIAKAQIDRLESLTAKMHRINAVEPKANQQLLQKCFDMEEKARDEPEDAPTD